MLRREVFNAGLAALFVGAAGCRRPRLNLFDEGQPFPSVSDLADHLREGRLSVKKVTEHYLDRISRLDHAGPMLRAVIEINHDARAIARRCDGSARHGPLHGVPLLIKDNIDTADRMHTTAGSLALLEGRKPVRDAFIVGRLRDAGAVILGKTNLSEWANIRSPHSTSGWSARGGLTRNPHKLSHSASGSSSGSAVAVAAGLAAAAIGTETNGSIVSPASACGIVGLKPTVGLVSRAGIVPITHWQDTAGTMTLTVRDAALLLNVMAGTDDRDEATAPAGAKRASDYAGSLAGNSLRGARLGVLRSQTGNNPDVLGLFEQTLEHLRGAGAVIVDDVELPHERESGRLAWTAMLIEFRADLNAYLAERGAAVRSLADLIAFNDRHRAQEMPHFGQEFFEQAERLGTPKAVAAGEQARAAARRLAGPEGIDAALQAHHLDALICPTADPAGKTDLTRGDADDHCASTPAAVAGYPHLTVPMGFVIELPVGLSFIGSAWSEAVLLGLGHAFEQAMPARRMPAFAL